MRHDRYATLDGLRGVAAIAIAVLHIPHFTGGWHLSDSFLAVDLFFVLSGYVLAKAYETKFAAGMTAGQFLQKRLIRLFPFYALGTSLGVIVAIAALRFGGGGLTVEWSVPMLTLAIPLSFLMAPVPAIGPNKLIYPLNPVLWSILFELAVNFTYVLAWPFFRRTRSLLIVTGAFGMALISLVIFGVSLDGGFAWNSALIGVVRVGFSFFSGVSLARLSGVRRVDGMIALVCTASLPLVFAVDYGPIYQLGCILFFFPLLVTVASKVEPPPSLSRSFEILGLCSYPMYALHKPMYQLTLGALMKTSSVRPERFAPWSAVVFLLLLAVVSYVLTQIYDLPIRRWLTNAGYPRTGKRFNWRRAPEPLRHRI